MAQFFITDKISLGLDELEESFIRSSGPGGQNVNKVSSAVQLRFNVRHSSNLPDRVKQKILASGDSRLTKNGILVINAERHRTQELNRQDARERLKEIIRHASHVPKRRIVTKPTRNSQKRRVDTKIKRGLLKKGRGKKVDFD